jgi:hypothetical protein
MTSSPPPPPPGGQPPQFGQPGHPGHPPPGQAPQPPPVGNAYAQPAGTGSGLAFDLKKLRMADYVVAAGAVLYLIAAVLPWVSIDYGDAFGIDVPGDTVTISGFSYSGLVSFSFVLFLLAAAWAFLPAFTDVKLGFPRAWVTVGLAALGLLLTLFAWIASLGDSGFEIAPLLGLLVAVAITLFALLGLLPELRNRPALPGGLANAAQWANQQAPGFGAQGNGPAPSGHAPPPPPAPSAQPPAQPGGQYPPPATGPTGPATPPYGPPAGGAAPGGPAAPGAPGPERPGF